MKTGVKIGLGIAAVAAAFLAWNKFGKKLSPIEKMTKDVLDPNTIVGTQQRNSLVNSNLPLTKENILAWVKYRIDHPEDPQTIAYNSKKSWGANEVVPLSGLGLPMAASAYLLR
jgi:hypothetical protein